MIHPTPYTAYLRMLNFRGDMRSLGINPEQVNLDWDQRKVSDEQMTLQIDIHMDPDKPIEDFRMLCYAVMGLITHYYANGWVKSWFYVKSKTLHYVTFTSATTEDTDSILVPYKPLDITQYLKQ